MCTRVFNNINPDFPTTGRNMDWATQLATSIFTFKSSLKKTGMPLSETDNNTLTWTSRYDSVVAMVIGGETNKITDEPEAAYAASDGMNAKGLMANALYDTNAKYGDGKSSSKKLSVLRWVQYVLDTCGSVAEVVQTFTDIDIQIIGAKVPGSEKEASLHLSISDADSESAIIEVHNGKYNIYYKGLKGNKGEFRVMTNEPSYAAQIILNQYWRWQWSDNNPFPSHTIPGTPFSSARFERASYYLNSLESPRSMNESLAQVKTVVKSAAVPIGFARDLGEDYPKTAPTLWSTMVNNKEKVYYFSNSRTLDTLWVDLTQLNNKCTCDVSRLDMVINEGTLTEPDFDNKSIHGSIYDNTSVKNCTSDPYRAS